MVQQDDSTVNIKGDVDWDTFEDIESYISQDASSVFELVIPTVLWEYVFAPTSRDAAMLRRNRASVRETYRGMSEFYAGTESELIERSHLSTEGGEYNSISGLLEDINPKLFPASLTPPDQQVPPRQYATLSEEITALEEAISEEKDAVKTSECLLSNPEAAFLYKEERADLRRIRNVLSYSVEVAIPRKNELVNKRTEVIESLDRHIEEWQEEIDRLESQAKPYLELETVADIEGLVADVQALEADLESVRDEQPLSMVSHSLVTQFNEVEQRVLFLADEIQQCRAEFAEEELDQMLTSVRNSFLDIKQRVKARQENGDSLSSAQTLLEEIDALRGEINSVRESPHASNAPESHVNDISRYETRLDEYEVYIEEKTWFDSEIEAHADALTRLREGAEPYLNFDQYLTEPQRATLTTKIHPLVTELKELNEEADFSVLSAADRRRLQELQKEVGSLRTHLKEYNSTFVRQQRQECADLFSDIGHSNLDLTKEQQRAVIRNGIYNQVIAAAGTGKTMTLAARVNYLIRELNADPQRILLLSFGSDAADEMSERLKNYFGIYDVSAKTIHKFGLGIIRSADEPSPEVFDENDFDTFVDDILSGNSDRINEEFVTHFERYLKVRGDEHVVAEDFNNKKKYYEGKQAQRYSTLDNETVKSVAERRIANFLFRHQIEYRYEARAEWVETGEDYETYSPDFYLPKYDIYIEHWGVDERGEVTPWFNQTSEEYRESTLWKREQFAQTDEYALIETHEFEHASNTLETVLAAHLERHEVAMNRVAYAELVEATFDRYERKRIKKQLKRFIDLAKTFRLNYDDIQANIENLPPDRRAFGSAGLALLEQYESHLDEIDCIDFADMVNRAIKAIDTGQSTPGHDFDHVLVDEFQDLGDNQLELIDRITGPDAARLFCVGDDWQSIYSFNGADVNRFIEFEEYFGEVAQTRLTANYRCPDTVVRAGNDLIQANEQQIDKEVSSNTDTDTTPLLHELDGSKHTAYDDTLRDYVRELVGAYLDQGTSPDEIRILCRYEAGSHLDAIREGLRTHGVPLACDGGDRDAGVSISTVHKAKGTEARHVILVDVVEGALGFPAVDQTNNLLEPVRPVAIDSLAEERRLFYVALTRSSGTLDLLTRSEKSSRFIGEIQKHVESAWAGDSLAQIRNSDTQTGVTAKLRRDNPHSHPSIHQSGVLQDLTGAVDFVTWAKVKEKLEVGEWYEFTRIYPGTYNEQLQLEVKRDTMFEPCCKPSVPIGEITTQTD